MEVITGVSARLERERRNERIYVWSTERGAYEEGGHT